MSYEMIRTTRATRRGIRQVWAIVKVGFGIASYHARKADAQRALSLIRSGVGYPTELTPEGEQTVIPGCERRTTPTNPQGELFS